MIKLAHAINGESGKAYGKRGDQTGREICIWNWYKSGNGWEHCFRCKDEKKARRIAEIAIAICKNDNIGYSQPDRLSLYEKSKGCYVSQIKEKCNTDCSAMVAVCCIKAGIKVNPSMYTGNQRSVLMATRQFEDLTGEYLTGTKLLKPGDILMRRGHTAVVVDVYSVPDLQECLNSFGYGLKVDGCRGPKTNGAIADLKKRIHDFDTILENI